MEVTNNLDSATGRIDVNSGNPLLSDRAQKIWDVVSKYITEEATILDIGCGTGWVCDFHKGNYIGIDTWKEQMELNKKRCPDATFLNLDLKDLKEIPYHNILVEFGMNTYYGINGKNEVILNSNADYIFLETPLFWGTKRLFNLILTLDKYEIELMQTIDTNATRQKRLITVLKNKTII